MLSRAFGHVLRELRLKKGLSQEALGHEVGLHRTYISQLERGLKSPSLNTMARLSACLGIAMSKLAARVEAKQERLDL